MIVSVAAIRSLSYRLSNAIRSGSVLVGRMFLVILTAACYAIGYVSGSLLRLILWCVASFIAGFQVGRR